MSYREVFGHQMLQDRESTYIRWYPKTLVPAPLGMMALEGSSSPVEGFYIHVPFCDKVCRFCPFNKRPSQQELISDFVRALCAEIEFYAKISRSGPIRFIYFGGGTPTSLTEQQLAQILNHLHMHFDVSDDCEMSIEAHPSHVTPRRSRAIRGLGFNRISIGVQSFCDQFLERMGAHHTSEMSRHAIEQGCAEFENVAIDLLYRLQNQSLQQWKDQLSTALKFDGIKHISCYSLILKNMKILPDPQTDLEMCVEALELFESRGFRHYASCASGGFDVAREGYECRYAKRHWEAPQANYIPLGPGAIGQFGGRMLVNGLGVEGYVESLLEQGRPYIASSNEIEVDEARRKYFVIGVKTLSVDLKGFNYEFGVSALDCFGAEFDFLSKQGLAYISNDRLILTATGRLLVDSVSELFFSERERSVPHPEEPEIRRAEIATNGLTKAASA